MPNRSLCQASSRGSSTNPADVSLAVLRPLSLVRPHATVNAPDLRPGPQTATLSLPIVSSVQLRPRDHTRRGRAKPLASPDGPGVRSGPDSRRARRRRRRSQISVRPGSSRQQDSTVAARRPGEADPRSSSGSLALPRKPPSPRARATHRARASTPPRGSPPNQPHDQAVDRAHRVGPAPPHRPGPGSTPLPDQVTAPAQHLAGRTSNHIQRSAPQPQRVQQRRQQNPARSREAHHLPGQLALQHRDLIPQDQDPVVSSPLLTETSRSTTNTFATIPGKLGEPIKNPVRGGAHRLASETRKTSARICRGAAIPTPNDPMARPLTCRNRAARPPATVLCTAPLVLPQALLKWPLTWGFSWWQVLGSNQRRLSRRFYSLPITILPHRP